MLVLVTWIKSKYNHDIFRTLSGLHQGWSTGRSVDTESILKYYMFSDYVLELMYHCLLDPLTTNHVLEIIGYTPLPKIEYQTQRGNFRCHRCIS